MRIDWTKNEVELVVAGYFSMWSELRAGRRVNKEERYRALAKVLNGRTASSVSRKCQNISAVLQDFGCRWMPGLMPNPHYQALLAEGVLEWIDGGVERFDELAVDENVAAESEGTPEDVLACEDQPPPASDPLLRAVDSVVMARPGSLMDCLARDQRNRELGRRGEEFVVEFERRRLHDVVRRPDLSRRVDWVAQTQGDGLGYDIASFEDDERPRLIEVKTTRYGKCSPFFVTTNEVRVSKTNAASYHLYRVFDFSRSRRLFRLKGALDSVCQLQPQSFVARVGQGASDAQ